MRRGGIAVATLALTLALVIGLTAVLGQGGTTVTITDSGFVPPVVTVPARSVVTWTNSSAVSHTVTALRGEFSSGVIPPGGVYSYLFTAPGEYPYRDLLSSATGKVVVGEGVYRVFLPLVMQNYGQ
jgi:plastocyanin